MNLEPYQQAGQEIQRQNLRPIKAISGAASLAGTLGSGGVIAKRILPLLSQFVPANLMRKGLEKIDPKLGRVIENALNNGYDIEEVRDFLSSKFSPTENPNEAKQETQKEEEHPNITLTKDLQTRYPHIVNALMKIIQQGQPPQAAAGIIKTHSQFSKDVKKIEKETGKNFVDLILELLGPQNQQEKIRQQNQGQQMNPQNPQMQPQKMGQAPQQMQPSQQQLSNALARRNQMNPQNPQMNPQNQQQAPQQGGGLDQEIIAALDKILKM